MYMYMNYNVLYHFKRLNALPLRLGIKAKRSTLTSITHCSKGPRQLNKVIRGISIKKEKIKLSFSQTT